MQEKLPTPTESIRKVEKKRKPKQLTKPKNDGSFEADKQKMIYFLKVESLLKECVGAKWI